MWEEHRNTIWACRDERKAKAQTELHLVRDVRDNKKGFCKYMGDKRKQRENVGPLLNEVAHLLTHGMEKAEVLNTVFATFLSSKMSTQESQAPETRKKVCSKEDVCLVDEGLVRGYLSKMDLDLSP